MSDEKNRTLHCTDGRLMEWAMRYFTIRKSYGCPFDREMPFFGAVDHKGELTVRWNKKPTFSMMDAAEQAWVFCGECEENVVHQVLNMDEDVIWETKSRVAEERWKKTV